MEEIELLARYIFSTGKLMRDRIFRVQTEYLLSSGNREKFSELTLPQLEMIKIVRGRGQVSMSELSGLLKVSPPSASTMVERMVEKGLLERKQSVEDRRKVVVTISPEAIEDIQGIEDAILQSFVELLEKVGPETARKWCDVLEQVKVVLENESNLDAKKKTGYKE